MPPVDPKIFPAATRDARKVIVVDLGFLGDTVYTVPALWEIKEHYPRAELHVLTSSLGREVLEMAPCVDRAWAFPIGPPSPRWWQHWDIYRALRRERFDVAFNFNGRSRSLITTAIVGARHVAVRMPRKRKFWYSWLNRHWVERDPRPRPVSEIRRQFLVQCGFELKPARYDLQISETATKWAESAAPSGAMHISLNSATPFNEWPVEHYAAALGMVWRERPHLRVVASGSSRAREQKRLKQLRTMVSDERLQLLPENLAIMKLTALLRRCCLHFGPDSGVMHLAVAVGVPTVALFREQFGFQCLMPVGAMHGAVTFPCPCLKERTAACQASGRAECYAGIEPARVAQLICERVPISGAQNKS